MTAPRDLDRGFDRDFDRDLEAVAERERGDHEAPPSLDELEALRDGRLDPVAAERVRDFLAVHPEWARAYLDLARSAGELDEMPATAPDAAVDEVAKRRVWRALEAEISATHAPSEDLSPLETRRARRARMGRSWVAVAALALLAVGASILLRELTRERPHAVHLAVTRGAVVDIPADARRVEFIARLDGRRLDGRYELSLSSPAGVVATAVRELRPATASASLVVAVDQLQDGQAYRFEARPVDSNARVDSNAQPIRLAAFRLRVVE